MILLLFSLEMNRDPLGLCFTDARHAHASVS